MATFPVDATRPNPCTFARTVANDLVVNFVRLGATSNTIIRLTEFALVLYICDRRFLQQARHTAATAAHIGSFIEPVASGFAGGIL
jgi:hypothetical protein